MHDFESNLRKYADLALRFGLDLQAGQLLALQAGVETAPFVRLLAARAFELGAQDVRVEWTDDEILKQRYLGASGSALEEYPSHLVDGRLDLARRGAAFLTLRSPSAGLMRDADPARVAAYHKAVAAALKPFREETARRKVSSSLICLPNPAWAAQVFPDRDLVTALDLLWTAVFDAVRIGEADPVQAWRDHVKGILGRTADLNSRGFAALHIQGEGTSLLVELPEDHVWVGGGETNAEGRFYAPNLPSEEIFTAPKKRGVEGRVRSTKPLSYGGTLIDGFELEFRGGQVVDCRATRGEEILRRILETDAGASFLGEVALVPHDSPISRSGLVFYDTLFDENASCHLALGASYSISKRGGGTLSAEEREAEGYNASLVHVDFMIGSGSTNVDGIDRDGRATPLLRQGAWVF